MSVPIVSISEFKANPARFMSSGAVVTNHGKPRARLVPIDPQDSAREENATDAAKAALRVLYELQSEADVADELAELVAARNADVIGEPQ